MKNLSKLKSKFQSKVLNKKATEAVIGGRRPIGAGACARCTEEEVCATVGGERVCLYVGHTD